MPRLSNILKIVLFEDDADTGPKLRSKIERRLPRNSKVFLFAPSARTRTGAGKLYEDRLGAEIEAAGYDTADLWVTDRDLSKTPNYQGLSEVIVVKVADEFGVPVCKYARGAADEVFERQRAWGDAEIVLDSSSLDVLASQVVVVAQGFQVIEKKLERIYRTVAERIRTPAEVMAELLGHPHLADKIALYGSGDQKMVSEILPFAKDAAHRRMLRKRLPSLVGYWLYDSILRFPGVTMNSVAAASYLNISVRAFKEKRIRKLFGSAIYKGPFSDAASPHWWRGDIDLLLHKAGASDGNEYASSRLKESIPHCLDDGKRAGYYCMVTAAPVSEANSVGNISWFPPGADLARVKKDVYEQMAPWLGLF